RPMLDSGDLDMSLSGLKTAVRYAVADKNLSEEEVAAVARDFEDAAVGVLLKKTATAIEQYGAQSFILGGGVSANRYLREQLTALCQKEYQDVDLYLPDPKLSTDNSIMIALAGHAHATQALKPDEAVTSIRATGNWSL
ncbi:tRNA (adenosine(37)-N6)-threonylcarbamoyltransferase complex transferase subunit TsaD, partial [Candidatus Kaiserbacteria bacterium]|nr:tRNA (adenosine(37)-N6)-threonylcarbamoyltransferase complex transferase subunit TsaD [Candidatus Kaiserbacteria bacterium]